MTPSREPDDEIAVLTELLKRAERLYRLARDLRNGVSKRLAAAKTRRAEMQVRQRQADQRVLDARDRRIAALWMQGYEPAKIAGIVRCSMQDVLNGIARWQHEYAEEEPSKPLHP